MLYPPNSEHNSFLQGSRRCWPSACSSHYRCAIARMIMDTTAYNYIVRLIIRPARESRELITGTVVPTHSPAAVPIQAKPRKNNNCSDCP
jgi:hypothetical protein